MSGNAEYYPLTHPQKGIWYTEKLYPGTSIGNIAATLKIIGNIDYSLLEKAINVFIQKNDGIRLRIVNQINEPKQYVSKYEYKKIEFFDFTNSGKEELYAWDSSNTKIPFQIHDNDLYYFAIFKVSETEGGFYIKIHHLLSDAWTFVLLGNQIIDNYLGLVQNKDKSNEIKPSYINYILNESEYEKSDRFYKDKEFWNNKFNDAPELTTLKARNKAGIKTFTKRKTFIVPNKLNLRIQEYCKNNKTSVAALFVSALAMYITRVTGNKDIIIGTPLLNRTNAQEKNIIGMFVNTVPLRINVRDSLDFKSFAQNITKEWFEVLKHQKYPYELLIKDIREKHSGIEDLFDIVISYQNAKVIKEHSTILHEGRWHFNGHQRQALSIHLNDREDEGNTIIDYDYLSSVFYSKEVEFIHDHIIRLLWHALDNSCKKLCEIDMLSENEKNLILNKFNDTKVDYPKSKTITMLFEEQIDKIPDKTAIIFDDYKLSYKELNRKANYISKMLIKLGVGKGSFVPIIVKRSPEILIAMLAIMKTGGAFLPIDPEYPDERIRFMLDDCRARVAIIQRSLATKINYKGKIIDIFAVLNSDDQNVNFPNPILNIDSEEVVYVIYTSGSTGKPKGTLIKHRSLNNFLHSVKRIMSFITDDVVLSVATISFDLFILETFPTLFVGATVVMANEEQQKDHSALCNLIASKNVTKILLTPTRMQVLLENEEFAVCAHNLKDIMLGGEKFPKSLLSKLKKNTAARIYNAYGPTETTIASTFKELTYATDINIGRPIDNTKIYILDKYLKPLPIGIPGEIYIGGDGVGKGYFNRDTLTEDNFINSPFNSEIIYKTGDMGRWYSKGEIEFLGRMDNQVKIRGLRIELSEIENIIMKFAGVNEVVVIDREDVQNRQHLCAYIVCNEEFLIKNLRSFLATQLPGYMIPAFFTLIDKIPITPNGKLDRKSLPVPDLSKSYISNFVEPTNKTEEELVDIWKKTLNIDKIGINDNFFELGGDSLSLISLMSHIHRKFKVDIPLNELYRMFTIKEISEAIQKFKEKAYFEIPLSEVSSYYPISSAQKRIFILTEYEKNSLAYNMPFAAFVDGKIDKDKLEDAINKLIQRHDIFKTAFKIINGKPVQVIIKMERFKIKCESSTEEDVSGIIQNFVRPFDLSDAPLLRISLIKLKNNKQLFLMDMHHIISDGVSMEIILNEMNSIYNGNELTKVNKQYRDYAVWNDNLIGSEDYKKQEQYWLDVFKDEIPILDLPLSHKRKSEQRQNGAKYKYRIDSVLTDKLKKLAYNSCTTLFSVLFSIYNILLSKYSGQNDIIVGTPVAGRKHLELENMVGMFVNTLAIRNEINLNSEYIHFLKHVRDNIINAFENQDFPFEELVGKLKITRDINRNPLFDTMFTLQRIDKSNIEICGFKVKSIDIKPLHAKFDLTLETFEQEGSIILSMEYRTELFTKNFIQSMLSHYVNIAKVIVDNPEIKLNEIDYLNRKEKQKVLFDFNRTDVEFIKDRTVQQLFEEITVKVHDKIAIIFENCSMTYSELNSKANQIALMLRNIGIGANSIVGVYLTRSTDLIVGILGILKAGGAYLPIDIDLPTERIMYILNDSNASALLAYSYLIPEGYKKDKIIYMDKIIYNNCSNLVVNNKLTDLSYVIYTSGSTGIPKGVLLTRGSLNNLIRGMEEIIDYKDSMTAVSITTSAFDIFIFETIIPLIKGLTVVIANEEQRRIPQYLSKLIIEYNVDILQTTPSRMEMLSENKEFLKALAKLKTIVLGGEVFTESLFRKIRKYTNAKIYNGYGPTETTVYSTFQNVDKVRNLNIGKPICNTKVFILDSSMKPVPVGVAGELCIAGEGLGKGYLNNPKLTNEKYVRCHRVPAEMIYKTGDYARFLPNGDLEYIGRKDNQIKIRGLRIELGEIESLLMQYKGIKKAITIINENEGKKTIIAYYLSGNYIEPKEIRTYLTKKLPDYMIPPVFIRLDEMPLTPSGKIDKKKLPIFNSINNEERIIELPEDEIENRMLAIWSETLNIDSKFIGVNDNFFEIGGDSLSVIRIQTKILKYEWDISTQDFFRYPTIRLQARKIKGIEMKPSNFTKVKFSNQNLNDYKDIPILDTNNIKSNEKKGTLLTGATGFLGIHILYDLIAENKYDVFCLVKGKNNYDSTQKLQNMWDFYFQGRNKEIFSKRVHTINGDITKINLGLSQDDHAKIKSNVGKIIHSAALVKHYGVLSEFESINVIGTKNIVKFALSQKIEIFHISTMSVIEKDLEISQNLYVKSKIDAEKIIKRAIKAGLNATIIRVGNLTGRYSDGQFQYNLCTNAFYRKIKSLVEIGCVPKEIINDTIEFTPVDCCSKVIIQIIENNNNKSNTFNVFNPDRLSLHKFIVMLRELGYDISIVDNEKFKNTILAISNDNKKQDYLAGIVNGLGIVSEKPITELSNLAKNLIKTKNSIPNKFMFQWPEIDNIYIDKIFKYIENTGFILKTTVEKVLG